jgi:hypothetical protein
VVVAAPPLPPLPDVTGAPPAPCVVLAPPSPVVVDAGPVVALVSVTPPVVALVALVTVSPPVVCEAKSLMTAIVSVSPLHAAAKANESANLNVVGFEIIAILHRSVDHQ